MQPLLKPTWQASVAARSASALNSMTVESLPVVTVVVRRWTRSVK